MAKPFFFQSWMIGQLRKIFHRYPPYYLTLKAVRIEVPNGVFKTGKRKGQPRVRVFYPCTRCPGTFSSTNIVVDHIDPVIDPKVGFPLTASGDADWTTYIKRLFCDITNLQVLCVPCHNLKSGKETKVRVKNRKIRKDKLSKAT